MLYIYIYEIFIWQVFFWNVYLYFNCSKKSEVFLDSLG